MEIIICNQVRIVGGNEASVVFGWRFLLLRKQPATKHVKIDVLEIVKSLGEVKAIGGAELSDDCLKTGAISDEFRCEQFMAKYLLSFKNVFITIMNVLNSLVSK